MTTVKTTIMAIALLAAGCQGADRFFGEKQQAVTPLIKARIAILFDTSGSMLENVCYPHDGGEASTGGDGSNQCPGSDVTCCGTGSQLQECPGHAERCSSPTCNNGKADDSRIYKVKEGVRNAVAAYGEIEWALFRFHQTARSFACGSSFFAMGGWQANSCDGDTHADRLVDFGPENQYGILDWMDNDTNNGNNPSAGNDIELRAAGFTPIARSLAEVKTILDDTMASDPAPDGCRPYTVVLVTDGQENCDSIGDAEDAARALRTGGVPVHVIGFASSGATADGQDAISQAGSGTDAFEVNSPAALSAALAQVISETIRHEVCNGKDDDCNGVIDDGFNIGADCDNGEKGACFHKGKIACVDLAHSACDAPPGVSGNETSHGCDGVDDDCDGVADNGLQCMGCTPEVCNGLDDDCNGTADDGQMPGVGAACGIALGLCTPGHLECRNGRLECVGGTGPGTEVCNGKDDNCDGVVDQISRGCYDFATGCVPGGAGYVCAGRCRAGSQTCTAATQPGFGDCQGDLGPAPEVCNGLDDDCDGVVDNGFADVGQACERGQGLCHTKGKRACSADGKSVVCDALVVVGAGEICNGVDDDCDGKVDDLPVPPPAPIGQSCGSCGGTFQCQDGHVVCAGGTANAETCNGLDDDCNGIADDGDLAGVGDSCVPGAPDHPQFVVRGECKPGSLVCSAGKPVCVNFTGPQQEICNDKDDDCDGVVDDAAQCPSATDACYQSACVSPCADSEFPCPFGYFCKELGAARYCVKSKCVDKTCGANEACDHETGQCKDRCDGVSCPAGFSCVGGRCQNCFVIGCAAGFVCQEGGAGAPSCVADKCKDVTCPVGQMCGGESGTCKAVDCASGCAAGEVCDDGKCSAECAVDNCAGAQCANGYVCDKTKGRCVLDPCTHTSCGELDCLPTCQGGATCGVSSLQGGIKVLATGSGGVSCEIGGSPRGRWTSLLVLGMLLVVVVRRRRLRTLHGNADRSAAG